MACPSNVYSNWKQLLDLYDAAVWSFTQCTDCLNTSLLDWLLQENFISHDDLECIREERTNQKQAYELFTCIRRLPIETIEKMMSSIFTKS